ncbi:hypothetical protein S101258_00344 [Lactiplantibacillus plantarum subsp. plantarum]|uniref:Uncharacterized protein n=1 Tax=Lactiplantibacillus plantarum subsp. plantarum TaxID=337330 RepID=A0A2S3U9D7_LACPN|nr:hypothetical protein S101258_00344 [Lactiplantibacillus plantarum subsp. plantarum]
MIILPLIFPVVITAVVKIFNQKSFGHILLKTFVYFFVITTIIIALFLLAAYYFWIWYWGHMLALTSVL